MNSYELVVSPKGQVTLPTELRRALGIRPGDRVEFQRLRDGTVRVRPLNLSVGDLVGSVAYDGPPRSVADMNEDIAEEAARAASLSRSRSGRAA